MSDEQKKPRLTLNRESRPYFEAAGAGRLVIKKCNACSRVHYYPRTICPHCYSDETAFVDASGRGAIYSYSVTRQAKPAYVIAYVTLEEGVTMLTNIVDCDVEGVRIGQKVKVKFVDAGEGAALPVFTPT